MVPDHTAEAGGQVAQLVAALAATEVEIAVLRARAAALVIEIEQARMRGQLSALEQPVDRLLLVRGIDEAAARVLAGVGITAFADLAALTEEDVRELGAMLGDPRRISRENWIEQAALLKRGIVTDFAARVMRGERDALASIPVELPVIAACEPAYEAATAMSEITAADEELIALVPAADAAPSAADLLSAEVVDLASRREQRKRRAGSRLQSAGRWAALTASIAMVLGIAVEGTGLKSAIFDQPAVAAACDSPCANLADAGQ